MRIHLRPLLLLVVLCAGSFLRAQQPAIIPKPVSTTWLDGHFMIDKNTVLVAEPSEASSTGFFNSYLEQVYGVHLRVVAPDRQPAGDYILLSTAVDGENITNGGASNPIGASAEEGRYSLKVNSRSEEHTSELQSPDHLVCRLLLEKKKHYCAVLRYRENYLQTNDVRLRKRIIPLTKQHVKTNIVRDAIHKQN